jgi:hypothetical protein
VLVRQAAAQGLLHLTYAGQFDSGVLPELRRVAESDEGTIFGDYVVRYAAARVVKEIEQKI